MRYKLMVIDDEMGSRKDVYEKVLTTSDLEPLFIGSRMDFENNKETPVDGYILDIFLLKGDWNETDAAELLKDFIQNAPRPAPVFLVSNLWKEETIKILDILKRAGESSAKVVQYLTWDEFKHAVPDGAESRMIALRSKLSTELYRWHGRSEFRPDPDDPIRILLLADIQFGDPASDPAATFAEHEIANKLVADNVRPDLIVIAGDITHSGRPDHFALAEERISKDLISALWGTRNPEYFRDRIVLVPGNHDVNLRFSACDKYEFDLTKKILKESSDATTLSVKPHQYYALDPFRRFALQLTNDRNFNDISTMSWVDRRFLHCGLRFFILNSVAQLSADAPQRASLGESAIREIRRGLVGEDSNGVFSIAVSHHGLSPTGASAKEIEIDDWIESGRSFYSNNGIRLWLYGHYHDFNVRSIDEGPFESSPLWLIQAPTARIKNSLRGFCLIDLKRKEDKVIDAFVNHYTLDSSGKVDKKGSRRTFAKG